MIVFGQGKGNIAAAAHWALALPFRLHDCVEAEAGIG